MTPSNSGMELALISGLVGALISAALSYWVRYALNRRAHRDAERRLAYVHFIKISELVALEVIVGSVVNVFFVDQKAIASLASSDGKYEPSHKISVLIVELLQKLTAEKFKEIVGGSKIPRALHSLADEIKESRLKPEQLASLPKDLVLEYSFFLAYLGQLRQILSLWADFFETDDRSWITADAVHEQWIAITRFFEHARSLRTAFIKHGHISSSEASNLLDTQIEKFKDVLLSKWKHQPKIRAAMEGSKKEAAGAAAQPALAADAPQEARR